ncbi:hypothetical protein LCGC14_1319130 [marine sediment metagenome]|uniref:Uncharacterized protein n=1 Tax=marine sediment metagenome TaxID=412755 RepID=A0A0F9NMB1_9ZZZZ
MRAYELLTEYQELGPYGGWISDKNEIFGINTPEDHLYVINQQGFATFERAFEAGWVRIIWKGLLWGLEGMPKDVKRAFRKIAKRFFEEVKSSSQMTLHVDLLSDPMDRYTGLTSDYFIMPKDKARLIQFMNGL